MYMYMYFNIVIDRLLLDVAFFHSCVHIWTNYAVGFREQSLAALVTHCYGDNTLHLRRIALTTHSLLRVT